MFHYYKQKENLQLDPPIVFGHQHSHNTRCSDYFANTCNSKLSRARKYFHCSASTYWNSIHATASFPSALTGPFFVNYAKSIILSYVIMSVKFVTTCLVLCSYYIYLFFVCLLFLYNLFVFCFMCCICT